MNKDIILGIGVIAFFVGAFSIIGYIVYSTYYRDNIAPTSEYCSKTVPIIYVNQTALTNNDKCLDFLLEKDYKLVDKNGSYYILENLK